MVRRLEAFAPQGHQSANTIIVWNYLERTFGDRVRSQA